MPNIACSSCKKVLKIGDGMGGKMVRCPACQQTFTVPKEDIMATAISAAPAPAPPAAPPPPAYDDAPKFGGEDQPAKPKRRFNLPRMSQKTKLWVIVGGSLAAVLLISSVVLWAWIFGPKSAPFTDELRYLPKKPRFIVSIDLRAVLTSSSGSEFLKSEAYKQVKKLFEKENDGADFEDFILEQTGLKIREIRRITLFGSFIPDEGQRDPPMLIVVKVDDAKKFKLGSKFKGGALSEEKAGSFTINANEAFGYCVADDRTVVAGQVQALKEVLRREGKPDISKTMEAAIREANFANPIAVAFDLKDIVADSRKPSWRKFGSDAEAKFWDDLDKRYEADTAGLFDWYEGAAIRVIFGSRIEGKATLMFKAEHGKPLTASIELDTKTVLKLIQDGAEMTRAEQERSKRTREFFDKQRAKPGPQ